MNHHTSRQQSMNALRRNRNFRENTFVAEVVVRIIDEVNRKASEMLEAWEFPVDFSYPLSEIIQLSQKNSGITPYLLRDSKIEEIIILLEKEDSGLIVAVADRSVDNEGKVSLQMFRA
jgi:hypothetical protein